MTLSPHGAASTRDAERKPTDEPHNDTETRTTIMSTYKTGVEIDSDVHEYLFKGKSAPRNRSTLPFGVNSGCRISPRSATTPTPRPTRNRRRAITTSMTTELTRYKSRAGRSGRSPGGDYP